LLLIRSDDYQLVESAPAEISFDTLTSSFTFGGFFAKDHTLSAGTYLVRVDCFDGNTHIGSAMTAIEKVAESSSDPPAQAFPVADPLISQ
jgi:hypothetical protein